MNKQELLPTAYEIGWLEGQVDDLPFQPEMYFVIPTENYIDYTLGYLASNPTSTPAQDIAKQLGILKEVK